MALQLNLDLSPRQRKLLKWVGYPILAFITFLFALSHTFPYQRLEGKIAEALAKKYDVEIDSIGPTFLPGGLVLSGVSLTTRAERPDDKPVTFIIDEIVLDFGLLAALTGDLSLAIEAHIGDGVLEGDISYNKAGLTAELETEGLPLGDIPGVAGAVGLPMEGGMTATIRLKLPKMKWRDAEGKIEISCDECTVGDGKTKLKMQPQAAGGSARRPRRASVFAAEGITVPKLNLGETGVQIDIKNGIGTIKKFSAKSKDGELSLEGRIEFRDPFKQSKLPGCLRFKLSDALKQREPDFGNIEFMLPEMARLPDGQFAIPTKGTLAALGWDVRRRCSSGDEPADGERSSRPVITERAPDLPVPTPESISDEEKARRAAMQPAPSEPGAEPGASGPPLSPSAIRGAADDVRSGETGGPVPASVPGGVQPASGATSGVPTPEPPPPPPPESAEPPPEGAGQQPPEGEAPPDNGQPE